MKVISRIAVCILCLTVLQVITVSSTFGQLPSRDNFNFIFENNYEDDQLGRYTQTDFIGDWNFGSSKTIPAHQVIDILSDSDTRYNKVMRAYFAKGTVGPDTHGAYWESPIPGCTEIYFSYDVKFKPGFQWVIGGKIPGVFGGKMAPGVMPGPTDGFSARVMWKENGRPVAYIYHQNQTTLFGNSYYWGDFAFTSGRWYNVTIRVVLNTIGSANGIYEGYIDGKLMFQKKDLKYRGVDAVKIEKMNISMFFGGSTQDWAPTRDEWIDTDNFVAYTYTSKAPNVPRGIQASSANRILLHPYYNFENTKPEVINAPTDFISPAQTESTIDLTWKDNSDLETGFVLYRSTSESSGYSEITKCESNETSCTDKSLNPGTIYYYKLRAFNSNGYSDYTPALKVTTKTPVVPVKVNQPPVIANQTFSVQEPGFSSLIGTIVAKDPDAAQSLTYSINSGNTSGLFTLNPKTGQLSARNEIFGPLATTYKLEIKVTDNAEVPLSSIATIIITAVGNSSTVYIDPGNTNDPYSNGSKNHPFSSWINVSWKEGYSYLQKCGTTANVANLKLGANFITISSYGEGSKPVIQSTTTSYLISGFEKSGIRISNLVLEAEKSAGCIYFLGSTSDSIIVENCVIKENTNAIKVVDASKLVIRYNRISSEQEGIFSTATNNSIYYNIFESCNSAVNIMSNSASAEIFNNVFANNMNAVSVTYATLTLYNNIFYLSDDKQSALTQGTGKLNSDNNIYYPEQQGFITIAGKKYSTLDEVQKELKVDLKSFTSDPQFKDMLNNDYSLLSSSPAINSGRNVNQIKDMTGNKVPIFSATDIGAFEFTGNVEKKNIDPVVEERTLKIYPNPSSGPCMIEIMLDESSWDKGYNFNISELVVSDITGKVVLTKQISLISNTFKELIDLSDLKYGVYFVIVNIGGQIIKEKLLITK